jgi:hypothetical protein
MLRSRFKPILVKHLGFIPMGMPWKKPQNSGHLRLEGVVIWVCNYSHRLPRPGLPPVHIPYVRGVCVTEELSLLGDYFGAIPIAPSILRGGGGAIRGLGVAKAHGGVTCTCTCS